MTQPHHRDGRFTAEHIISGIPWATSSLASAVNEHIFTDASDNPVMAQWVYIKNTGTSGSLSVAFTNTGISTNNYFSISAGTSFEKPMMVDRIFVSGAAAQPYQVVAGLTRIHSSHFPLYLSASQGYSNI